MKPRLHRARTAALLGSAIVTALVIAGLAVPSFAAEQLPDLVITGAGVSGLGTHPHAVLNADGTIDKVEIHVTTLNRGAAEKQPSRTAIEFDLGGSRHVVEYANIPALRHGEKVERTVAFKDLRPELGFTKITATADVDNAVKESKTNEGNNTVTVLKFPVEAQYWDVHYFIVEAEPPGTTSETEAKPRSGGRGFRFSFDHYDDAAEQFVYTASGPVKHIAGTYGSCNSPNTKSVAQDPWANSFLKIDGDLQHYDAVVVTHSQHFMATYNCSPSGSFTTEVYFHNLVTFKPEAVPTMSPDAPVLQDKGDDSQQYTTYSWKFAAVIP